MNLNTRIQLFLGKNQTTGWLILLMVAGFVAKLTIFVITMLVTDQDTAARVINSFALPLKLTDLVFQPWSLATWPFFPDLTGLGVIRLAITGYILYIFGRIHQQLLGDERTRRMIILAIPIIGLLTVSTSTILGYVYTEEVKSPREQMAEQAQEAPKTAKDSTATTSETEEENVPPPAATEAEANEGTRIGYRHLALVGGVMPIVLMLVIGVVTLVPEYPIQMFLFGQVKIVYIGLILFLIEWMMAA
ncbi:MAG: hypothetical protein AAFY71_25255, partial [Bacteroidota bacterium]